MLSSCLSTWPSAQHRGTDVCAQNMTVRAGREDGHVLEEGAGLSEAGAPVHPGCADPKGREPRPGIGLRRPELAWEVTSDI